MTHMVLRYTQNRNAKSTKTQRSEVISGCTLYAIRYTLYAVRGEDY
jgi:hypothetical protein